MILDTNRFSMVFSDKPDPEYAPVVEWLFDGDGLLVFGGTQYRAEIARHAAAQRVFVQLARAGRARSVVDGPVDAEAATLRACQSNDSHIVALARVSGARTVCTDDHELMIDIRKKALLDKPRGRVYQRTSHRHLLRHDPCCFKPTGKSNKRVRRI